MLKIRRFRENIHLEIEIGGVDSQSHLRKELFWHNDRISIQMPALNLNEDIQPERDSQLAPRCIC